MKKRLIWLIGTLTLTIALILVLGLTSFATSDEITPSLTIASNTLELKNAVFMNFKVEAKGIDENDVTLLVWETAPNEYSAESADCVLSSIRTEENTGYIVFQYNNLAAKDMTKFIYVCAYAKINGEAIYSNPVKFSIVQYAYNTLIDDSTPEYLEGILTNMLEYGAFSQLYFNHNTEFLATDEIAKIKVVNGTHADGFKTGYYKAGTTVTLTANEAEEGFIFSHWEDSEGAEVGTETTLTIPECSSNTYTAVYVEEIKYSEGLAFTSNGDGTCYVSGIGTCTDADIVIPPTSPKGDKVIEIGIGSFQKNMNITSVIIPQTVQSIGDYAFEQCTNLTDVVIPYGVENIGVRSFFWCSGLTSITIPDSIKTLYSSSFEGCTISNVALPISAIYNFPKQSLKNVVFTSGTSVPDYTFVSCTKLVSVTINEGVTSMGRLAFYGCNNLINVVLPNTLKTIGAEAFKYCSNMKKIKLPDSLESIEYEAFYNCTSLTDVSIPGSVVNLDRDVFNGCTNLTNVEIGNGVTTIGASAFDNCNALIEVSIPKSVTSIEGFAFARCRNLTTITIPNSVTNIGNYAFGFCQSLRTVNYTGSKDDWGKINIESSGNSYLTNATINYNYIHSEE